MVSFGAVTVLMEFLRNLASASRLETLDLISLEAFKVVPSPAPSLPISLPRLKTLFLEDLFANVIQTVLSAIKPGTHRTVLSVSNKTLAVQVLEGELDEDILTLQTTFASHNIDTLVLGELWFEPGDTGVLHSLLGILPALTTIYFNEQHLDRLSLKVLTRGSNILGPQPAFPRLRRIYISSSTIDDIGDQTAFKNMLSSHPLEELVLGGSFSEVVEIIEPENSSNGDLEQVDIAGTDVRTISIKTWLQENVPKFTLLERTQHFGFKNTYWQLW